MGAKKTILLLKENLNSNYIVNVMAEQWTAAGYHVIHHAGMRSLPPADVVFLHVNRTVVPREYADSIANYPVAINGKALDISRRLFSQVQLNQDDTYDGPVIVKTNTNYGGVPEHRSVSRWFSMTNVLLRKTKIKSWRQIETSWSKVSFLDPLEYPIFSSIKEVPSGVWKNKHLMVEKFLPEKEGDLFFVRYWMFFGDKNSTGRYGARHPIVKFHRRATAVEPIDIPEELFLWRKRLHLDYGRFDYVLQEGRPIILDANKTLAFGLRSRLTENERKAKFADFSAGIEFYLK
jgi:hypothetical protein